jgi:UDP-glucose:(heptosyl)LPS alpha-1,3-glucosyltransferase
LPYTDAGLVVVGKDQPGPFQRLAGRLGVQRRIRFLGPRRDVHRLYGAADVFCLPSWYEPFSNACLEAMSAGLPVVTARETGAAEVIREGLNGFVLFFPVRPEDLGDRINRALKIDRRKLIVANDKLLEPFSWETNVNQTMAVYEELMG